MERSHRRRIWRRAAWHVTGLLALLWFLVRVIPKPSRALYPCQRAAFPYASAFVAWLIAGSGAASLLKKAQRHIRTSRYVATAGCVAIGVLCLWLAMTATSDSRTLAQASVAYGPLGQGRGIFPGRVVWVHDPNATSWAGRSYPWDPLYTSQTHVDDMAAQAIRLLAGETEDRRAWDAIFKHFNRERGKGATGYMPGQKIAIKINLTTCGQRHGSVNPLSYDKKKLLDKADTSPQIIVAVLRQLVRQAQVDPNNIAVGDTLCLFPNQWWRICHGEFPQVTCFDALGQKGRVKSGPSRIVQHWSALGATDTHQIDYIPKAFAEADYIINIAVLKSHLAGVSLCAKNHYGSFNRHPDDKSYFDLHESLAYNKPQAGQYRAFVDIMGHPGLGAKTLLYLIDGLYGGSRWQATPQRFQSAPFNNDWPSTILASLDPVAIDSVGLDILSQEWPDVVRIPAVDDYLHEAALANDPPSGTLYDPDGDGTPLRSLGVHEHWNNAADRKYSRNLGKGTGIELIYTRGEKLNR